MSLKSDRLEIGFSIHSHIVEYSRITKKNPKYYNNTFYVCKTKGILLCLCFTSTLEVIHNHNYGKVKLELPPLLKYI